MSSEPGDSHCCSVTLIVTGVDLDPAVVTAALDMTPDRAWCRGQQKSFVRGDGTTRVFDSIHDEGGWKCFMPSSEETWPIQDQLASWLERLSAFGNAIRAFNDRGWDTELYGFVATSEFLYLPRGLMSKLAGLGLSMALTFSPDRPAR